MMKTIECFGKDQTSVDLGLELTLLVEVAHFVKLCICVKKNMW